MERAQSTSWIRLHGEGGRILECRILERVAVDGKDYVLIHQRGSNELYVMRFVVAGGQEIYQPIEADEEFDRVVAACETVRRWSIPTEAQRCVMPPYERNPAGTSLTIDD
jgi:Protein of unknown function (DUF1292)